VTRLRAVVTSLLVGVTSLAILTGASQPAVAAGSRNDPGGKILAELSAIRHAVPPFATRVHVSSSEPVITASCDTTEPDVVERVAFTARRPTAQVQAVVSRAMRRAGWERSRKAHYRGYTGSVHPVLVDSSVVFWSRELPSGPAGGQLLVSVPVQGWHAGQPLQWILAASAQGVNLPRRHCGGP